MNTQSAATMSLKTASVLSWVAGLGFGLPGLYGMVHFQSTQELWTFLGFPTYGSGPFEDRGIDTSVPLLAAFNAVCAAEVASGLLLWRRRKSGAVPSRWRSCRWSSHSGTGSTCPMAHRWESLEPRL